MVKVRKQIVNPVTEAREWFNSLPEDEQLKLTREYNLEHYPVYYSNKILSGMEIFELYNKQKTIK